MGRQQRFDGREIRQVLGEVDRVAEAVAVDAAGDRRVQTLAFALHRLVLCVAELADRVDQAPPRHRA